MKSIICAICAAFVLASIGIAAEKQTCCEKAKAAGKECSHQCCIDAKKDGKVCEKCNPKKEEKK